MHTHTRMHVRTTQNNNTFADGWSSRAFSIIVTAFGCSSRVGAGPHDWLGPRADNCACCHGAPLQSCVQQPAAAADAPAQARHSAMTGEPLAVVSSHDMMEFVWDASLRDMPNAISFPRATMADCLLKSMHMSPAQRGNIHVFAGNIAPPETPGEFSRAAAKWMDTLLRSWNCTDVRTRAWPHGLPSLIGEWRAQSKHVQWISIGTLGNVAIALSALPDNARPNAVVAACHQASSVAAPVSECHIKLDPGAFTASVQLAQSSNTPLLLVLLNTSGYFCQWLAARSVEHATLEPRCFHSGMCGVAYTITLPLVP